MNIKTKSSRGRLAQMVERALWKFLTQWEGVQTAQAPGFFPAQNYFALMFDFESSKYAARFNPTQRVKNQGIFTSPGKKEAILKKWPCKQGFR